MTPLPSETFQTALELTQAWCRIPSVAGHDAGLARQAQAIVDWLRREVRAEIIADASSRGRAPLVHARIDVGAQDTVILYNMYDVMPASVEGWSIDPFVGGVIDLDGIGPSFVARGAENNKGPLAGMLHVIKALADMDRLKVNVEILVDGEEESGSGALRDYLLDEDCLLRRSKAALFPSFCEYGGGPPRVYLGFSGIAKGEVRVEGGRWGGPSAPIHSSNAPWIANPASRLVEALAHFGRPPTGGLDQIALDDETLRIIDNLAATFDPSAELRFRQTHRFVLEGDARHLLSHVLSTATINLSSLATVPADANAVIPSAAHARFELRCPPSLDPADYIAAFQRRLRDLGLDGAVVNVADCYAGFRFSRTAPGVGALLRAYAATSLQAPQIWPWAIGAAPAYAFARHSQSFLLAGAGRGGNAHGVNEFMTLEGYERFLQSISVWLQEMAIAETALDEKPQC